MAEKISEKLLLSTMTARWAEEEAGRCVEGSRNKLDKGKKCRFGSITTSLSGAGGGVKGDAPCRKGGSSAFPAVKKVVVKPQCLR
jgi:hypothetical protein